MKAVDIAFAATLLAMLVASLAAVVGVDHFSSDSRRMVRLEPIVITSSKARAAAASAVELARTLPAGVVPCRTDAPVEPT